MTQPTAHPLVPSPRRPLLRLVLLADLGSVAPADLQRVGEDLAASHLVVRGLSTETDGEVLEALAQVRARDVQVLAVVDADSLLDEATAKARCAVALGSWADGLFIEPGDSREDQRGAAQAARALLGPSAVIATRLLTGPLQPADLSAFDWLLAQAGAADENLTGLFEVVGAERIVVCPSSWPEPEELRELARLHHSLGGLALPLEGLEPSRGNALWGAIVEGHEISVKPESDPVVIPAPLQLDHMGVVYVAVPRQLKVNAAIAADRERLEALLSPGTGIRVEAADEATAFVQLVRVDGDPGAYHLKSRPTGITAEFVDEQGLAHLVAVWRQLLPDWVNSRDETPGEGVLEMLCVELSDAPLLPLRGLRLAAPVGFGPERVRRLVDQLFSLRLNALALQGPVGEIDDAQWHELSAFATVRGVRLVRELGELDWPAGATAASVDLGQSQSARWDEPGAAAVAGGPVPWQALVGWRPVELAAAQGPLAGAFAELDATGLDDVELVDFLLFPRLAVVAEIAWHGEHPDLEGAGARLRRHGGRLDAAGVNHRPLDGPLPSQRVTGHHGAAL